MKNKNRKGKYIDFDPDEFIKMQNNKSCSKESKIQKKNILNNNQKNKSRFQNCLEELVSLFPNFSRDVVEDIYLENNENFSKTKDKLRELSEIENNENKINENYMQIEKEEEQNEKKKCNKKKNLIDISEYSNLEVVANDESLENDKERDVNYINSDEDENKKEKSENIIQNNKYSDYNKLIELKEKNGKEYSTVFGNDDFDNNIITNTPTLKDETLIDDYLFDKNIEFLCNCFPEYKKEEIVKKICDFNFDINSVVSNILNETYENKTKDEEKFGCLEADDIEEILGNYENMEEVKLDDDIIKIQKTIENSIKSENINRKNNLYNDDYDMDKNNNNIDDEEFFLNKNIDEIQTPKIRNDLKKLILNFPNEEENNIKLVYYSLMDYKLTFDHFDEKDGTKNIHLKNLMNDINNNNKIINKEFKSQKTSKSKNNINDLSEIDKRRYDTLKKILENKPINWNLHQEKNINEKDFIAVRNRLFKEAKNCYANKKYNKGQILMNKAKRYQQEIEQIARNKGINQFFNNNAYNNNIRQIDLHGLHIQESKLIINSKLKQLREKKIEDNSKNISLTIITGIGSHSKDGIPVLYKELLDWLNRKEKLKVDGRLNEGVIYVTIY